MSIPRDSLSSENVASLTAIIAVIVASTFLLVQQHNRRNKKVPPPRDSSLPPLCTIRTWKDITSIFNGPKGPQDMLQLTREMGHSDYEVPLIPLSRFFSIIKFPPLYVLTDYRSARKALEDPKSTKFQPTGLFFERTTHGGPNIVTSEGHRWKHVRKSTSAAFSGANLKRMVEPIGSIVDDWIKRVLEPAIDTQAPIDILNEMNQLTADVIANVAFDYEFEGNEREQFLSDLNTCWMEFGVAAGSNIWKQLPFTCLFYPGIWKGKFAAKRMYTLCQKLLCRYRAKVEADRKGHKLIDMIVNDTEYADDGERCRDMIAYVIAGFDTTANTLSFALRELAMNPEEQDKLMKSLLECAKPEDARNCPQLKMAIKEIVRLYPAAALGSIRQLGSDLALPAETRRVIPKGSLVNTNYFCIQRDPKLFDNPDQFIPSRWESPTNEQTISILTFSLGKRNCQGQGLAMVEMKEILYKLVSKYRFSIAELGEPTNQILFKPVGTMLLASVADRE